MKNFFDDDSGQLILIALVFAAISIVMISTYEYSTIEAGEKSIQRENIDTFNYYKNIRERYIGVYNDYYLDFSKPGNITVFEKEFREFALWHGYSVDFVRNDTMATIIFIDKDVRIEEQILK